MVKRCFENDQNEVFLAQIHRVMSNSEKSILIIIVVFCNEIDNYHQILFQEQNDVF